MAEDLSGTATDTGLSVSRYWRGAMWRAHPLVPALPFAVWQHYRLFRRLTSFRHPKTFNELVVAKKLYDKNPLYTQTADKLAVRDYVAARVGAEYLIPLHQIAATFGEIRLEDLPDSFALKATHGSRMNLIVRDKEKFDRVEAERQARKWLRRNYYQNFKEWAYREIPPRLVVEELLLEGDQPPPDFKFWAFAGKVRLVQVDVGRFEQHRRSFFDENWRPLRIALRVDPVEGDIPCPKLLGEMRQVAETLSNGFRFARIDLYEHAGRVYFGEITHYPQAGAGTFEPTEFDRVLGNLWRFNEAIPDEYYRDGTRP